MASQNQRHLAAKVVILGDSGVGKSCILARLIDDTFMSREMTTIGVDFHKKDTVLPDNRPMQTILWDTCGQERFDSLIKSFYRGADAVVYVYDTTNADSFLHLTKWMNSFQNVQDRPKVQLILGNKCESYRKIVDLPTAMEFAKAHDIPLLEVSAKDGTNVEQFYQILVAMLADSIDERQRKESNILLPIIRDTVDTQSNVKTGRKYLKCCAIF